jgi:hypothetical protein
VFGNHDRPQLSLEASPDCTPQIGLSNMLNSYLGNLAL